MNGLHQLLLEQKLIGRPTDDFNHETPEIIESDDDVLTCIDGNHPVNNGIETLDLLSTSIAISAPETVKLPSPEELLMSSPEYNKWLRRLSSKIFFSYFFMHEMQ